MNYQINEVFYSIQGEGVRAGTANVFVRFSGCNLTCARDGEAGFDCDTEFASGRKFSASGLLKEIVETMERDSQPIVGGLPGIILTGGEPGLQVDDALLTALHAGGFYVAIETNGTQDLPDGIDWVCCSPKSAEHTLKLKRAHELKYVRNYGMGIPRPVVKADHYLISPAFHAVEVGQATKAYPSTIYWEPEPRALAWCIQLVKENPRWRLSVQQHKGWNVR